MAFWKCSCLVVVSFAFGMAQDVAPTDLDSLLRGKEYQMPRLDSSLRTKANVATSTKDSKETESSLFMLQFDAVADFDAAQKRREDLQRRTGYGIQLVFDAPYYKLRAGGWSKKEEAEDKARELSQYNLSAFVVKVR